MSVGAVASLIVNGFAFAWVAGSSFAWGRPLPGFEFTLLPAAVALLLLPVGVLLSVFPRTRATGVAVLAGGFVFALSFFIAMGAGGAVRMWGFERFALRSEALIDAIDQYSEKNGDPPRTLDQLVPDFLPAIPSTGVGSAPDFRYIVGEQALQRYDGNPWVLELGVPTGFINWDILIYYPDQNYPEYAHGGVLEPVERWAYVHE